MVFPGKKLIDATVDPSTMRLYRSRWKKLKKETGAISVKSLKQFICTSELCARTLRGYKSALRFYMLRRGVLMDDKESTLMDRLISGRECVERRRKVRGAISEDKVHSIVKRLENQQLADPLILAYGLAARKMQLLHLRRKDVFLEKGLVRLRAKRHRVMRNKLGRYVHHRIITDEAKRALERLVKVRRASKYLISQGSMKKCAKAVRRIVIDQGWNRKHVTLDGLHACRHGAAQHVLDEALEEVKAAGGWASQKQAKHYSTKK